MAQPTTSEICAGLLGLAGLPDDAVAQADLGPVVTVLPSSFRVTEAATALTGAVALVVSMLVERTVGRRPAVSVDPVGACVAFQSERHLRLGEPPKLWDDLGGHYRVADGFIQTHTNFPHHRAALLTALDLPTSAGRPEVEAVLAEAARFDVEAAVADAGGIAAAMRTMAEWRAEPHADHVVDRPPLLVTPPTGRPSGAAPRQRPVVDGRPLAGLRVLDLTRVIAGPVCARTLAALGADVLRIGADHLPVVDSILPDTTLGKRFAHADVTTVAGRQAVLDLAADADVVVTGFRPGALAAKGLGSDDFFDANPALIVAELSAFGNDGPWGGRRGFDSITQTATGIVAAEMEAFASTEARPLPCQLLDHGSGFLLALGVLAALLRADDDGGGRHVEATLLTTRLWLESLGTGDLEADTELTPERVERFTTTRQTALGPMRHAIHPGVIDGVATHWDVGPATPGADALVWI